MKAKMRVVGTEPLPPKKKTRTPKVPPEMAHLMVWHGDLRRRAIMGQHVEKVQFTEIQAYRDLFHLNMDEFDIEMLCHIDDVWMDCVPKPAAGGRNK